MREAGWRLVNADCVLDRRGAADRAAPRRDAARARRGGRRGRGQRPRDDDRPASASPAAARVSRRRQSRCSSGASASAGQRRDAVVDDDEPVARERGDCVRVASAGSPAATARSASRAPLPERALERRLLAQRLVAPAARRAAAPRAGTRRSAARARGTRWRRGRTAPARTTASKLSPVRSCTRRTLVSTGSTSRPKAKLPTAAAVYGPTPGQLGQVVGPAALGDRSRRAVQVDRAPVVAEPLPLDDDVGRRRGGERVDRRPALEPARAARHDAVDLRLLQHHLADEDRVRVGGLPPRQIAPICPEPSEKQLLHDDQPRRAVGHPWQISGRRRMR